MLVYPWGKKEIPPKMRKIKLDTFLNKIIYRRRKNKHNAVADIFLK